MQPAERKEARPAAAEAQPPPEGRAIPLLIGGALAAVTLLLYSAALLADFSVLDDDWYVRQNPHVLMGLTWESVRWALTHQHISTYHPITTLTHMADVQLFGLNPMGHHLVNVLLHTANVVLLFNAMRMLTSRIWLSALVAAIFALHPQHVESVVWISERKDVLSGLFFMLCLIAYARYARSPSLARYAVVASMFLLGLLSKPMLVTLPIVLLLLDYWPLRRRNLKGLLLEKLPLVALSMLFAVIAMITQQRGGAVQEQFPLGARLANACIATVRYVGMFCWPAKLSIFYPHPMAWPGILVVSAAIGLLLFTCVILLRSRAQPSLAVGWLWFGVMLLPVIGIVQVGLQAMADRYMYLPSIGLSIAVVGVIAALLPARPHKLAVGIGASVLLLILGLRAFAQVELWRNPEQLFATSLQNAGESRTLRANLAHVMWDHGSYEAAVEQLAEALKYDPTDDELHWRLGLSLFQLGRYDQADRHLTEAVQLNPRSAPAHLYLACLRKQQGKTAEAIRLLEQAIAINPNEAGARELLKQYRDEPR
jgi:hypothetical protein